MLVHILVNGLTRNYVFFNIFGCLIGIINDKLDNVEPMCLTMSLHFENQMQLFMGFSIFVGKYLEVMIRTCNRWWFQWETPMKSLEVENDQLLPI